MMKKIKLMRKTSKVITTKDSDLGGKITNPIKNQQSGIIGEASVPLSVSFPLPQQQAPIDKQQVQYDRQKGKQSKQLVSPGELTPQLETLSPSQHTKQQQSQIEKKPQEPVNESLDGKLWGPSVSDTSSTTSSSLGISAIGSNDKVKKIKSNPNNKAKLVVTASVTPSSQQISVPLTPVHPVGDSELPQSPSKNQEEDAVAETPSTPEGGSVRTPKEFVDEPYSIPFLNCLMCVTTPMGGTCIPLSEAFGAGGMFGNTFNNITSPSSSKKEIVESSSDGGLGNNEDGNKEEMSLKNKVRTHFSEAASSAAAHLKAAFSGEQSPSKAGTTVMAYKQKQQQKKEDKQGQQQQSQMPPRLPLSANPTKVPPIISPKSHNIANILTTHSKDTNDALYRGTGDGPCPSNLDSVNNQVYVNNNNIPDSNNDAEAKDTSVNEEKVKKKAPAPFALLAVSDEELLNMQREVSELTMRSSYASAMAHYHIVHGTVPANIATGEGVSTTTRTNPENNRRMAYYAVGQMTQTTMKPKNSGGNRRCYFTGKLILGGAPFYAGCVQQGLRTLVVFCLPSSLGLPDKTLVAKYRSRIASMKGRQRGSISSNGMPLPGLVKNGTGGSAGTNGNATANTSGRTLHLDLSNNSGHGMGRNVGRKNSSRRTVASGSIATASQQSQSQITYGSRASKFTNNGGTYYDERTLGTALSIESDLDPNWNIEANFLLQVLPAASPDLLRTMSNMYKDQFETLPVQVRSAAQWKLYIKFCFFSGLPICQEEVHYKIRDDIAEQVYYGEEITLSHEVMEACEGSASAELLTLPNRNVLQYIKKHYVQQCAKLDSDERIFQRSSWERVSPEV